MRDVTLEDVLCFWTGARAVPPMGFPRPSIIIDDGQHDRPLSVEFYDDHSRLPYVSTCGLILWLPIGLDDLDVNSRLTRALTECAGFGKV